LRPEKLFDGTDWRQAERYVSEFTGARLNRNPVVKLEVPGVRWKVAPDIIDDKFLGEVKAFNKAPEVLAGSQQKGTAAVAGQKGIPYYVFITEGKEVQSLLKTLVRETGGEIIVFFKSP
jgi:hypothetical protein